MVTVPARPLWHQFKSENLLKKHSCDNSKPFLFGIRGYFYKDNTRGIWDDLIGFISPTYRVLFNANTDPSICKTGIANLCPGKWIYQIGLHKNKYKALIQAEPVKVKRDQCSDFEINKTHNKYGLYLGQGIWQGMFGINIHKGGIPPNYITSSLGCQTIFYPQWEEFIKTVTFQMDFYQVKTIPYFLTTT